MNLIGYLVENRILEPGAPTAYSRLLEKTARLPIILAKTPAHAGILVGLIAATIIWILQGRSTLGYQIEAVGLNPIAAKSTGLSVNPSIIGVMALAGGLAGFRGFRSDRTKTHRLFDRFSSGDRFDAGAIAFLSRGNVAGVIFTRFFFAALRSGTNVMQRSAGVPVTVVSAIQGLTILFIALSFAIERPC